MCRMRLVHPHVTELMIEGIEDRDLPRLLQDLHPVIGKNEGQLFGPTLIAGGWKAHACRGNFAELLYDIGRPRLQDRIGEIADQSAAIPGAYLRPVPQARSIPHRTRSRSR